MNPNEQIFARLARNLADTLEFARQVIKIDFATINKARIIATGSNTPSENDRIVMERIDAALAEAKEVLG